MTSLKCDLCEKKFKGPQGLGSHMRWHREQKREAPRARKSYKRPPDPFQEKLLHVLEQHPQGISCGDIAVELQKGGYKRNNPTKTVARRVSSVASSKHMKSKIVRAGRGIYRMKASARSKKTATTVRVDPKDKTNELTAPKLPVEALHLRIDHLEKENNRLRRAMTMQNQTMQVLVTGD